MSVAEDPPASSAGESSSKDENDCAAAVATPNTCTSPSCCRHCHPDIDPPPPPPPPPTSIDLLHLSNLPPSATPIERQSRLHRISCWLHSHPATMRDLLTSASHRDRRTGCLPLHWAAGTGFHELIDLLLLTAALNVDQPAFAPSTSRTPLHYAARNGHLSTCRLLIETYGADPHPYCGRGRVTPLQLAVWQNHLNVVRYLVEKVNMERRVQSGEAVAECGEIKGEEEEAGGEEGNEGEAMSVVHERNGFNCGLMHWIGLVPRKRWGGDRIQSTPTDDSTLNGDDGSGVLPLARYLHSLGISYDSTPSNANTQGHTPMHKAAWGGNLPLIKYFVTEHGVVDNVQDEAGNYSADIAKMRGNTDVYEWLLDHGSADRAASYGILGLEIDADLEEVKQRYRELARRRHPDKLMGTSTNIGEGEEDFIKIKAAYEHIVKEGGRGKQKNPKFDELRLLQNQRRVVQESNGNMDAKSDTDDGDDLFLARLLAVISDYGDDGFPVSLLARRWNQIWPDRPFPSPEEFVIERTVQQRSGEARCAVVRKKKVKLLKWLKWKCRNSNVYFRNVKGDCLAFDNSKRICL